MIEAIGDLWSYHGLGFYVVIPTNTQHSRGRAHMGAGLAKQAAERFPGIPAYYAALLARDASFAVVAAERLILLPTKIHWRDRSTLALVETGLHHLKRAQAEYRLERVALPRLGCGLGGLDWREVRPLVERYLGDAFTVVTPADEEPPNA